MSSSVTIGRAETPADIDAARAVIRDFYRWVMESIEGAQNPTVFAGLGVELAGLPGRFGPPSGCLLLARLDGMPAGCVAFYGQDAATMEIKRLFVRLDARGHRIGQLLVETLLAEARAAGYRRAVLWSHHSMHAAHEVYHRAGFHDVPCSADFPGAAPGVDVCMEMTLAEPPFG